MAARQKRDTVRDYPEMWLWPGFLRQALRDAGCPELEWEQGRVDCRFLGTTVTPVATFELKMISPVALVRPEVDNTWFKKLIGDFKKQMTAAEKQPLVEHYVVLLPSGELDAIGTWVEQSLKPKVVESCPGIRLHEIPSPREIRLNRPADGYVLVKVFRVNSTLTNCLPDTIDPRGPKGKWG